MKTQETRDFSVGFDAVDNRGLQLLDELSKTISIQRVIGSEASDDGLARALIQGIDGYDVDNINPYQPGIDSPLDIDFVQSLANNEVMARKKLSTGSPRNIQLIIDEPERVEMLEGRHTFREIGNFTLAAIARVAEVTDSNLRIYHSNAPRGLLLEGDAEDAPMFYNLKKKHSDTPKRSLKELLDITTTTMESDSDASVIVSDFMDGYDPKTQTFAWENSFTRMAEEQEDLMRVVRVMSRSHERLPYGFVKALDYSTVASMNEAYAPIYAKKVARLEKIMKSSGIPLIEVSLNDQITTNQRSIVHGIIGEPTDL